jgi:hypothetical protein
MAAVVMDTAAANLVRFFIVVMYLRSSCHKHKHTRGDSQGVVHHCHLEQQACEHRV